jgi:hypothetical protein
VTDSYKHYSNRYRTQTDKLRKLARECTLTESLQKVVLRSEIYAKRLSQPVTLLRRTGVLNQPGRPKSTLHYIAQADTGDYLAQQDGEDVIVPAALLEAIFAEDEPVTVS